MKRVTKGINPKSFRKRGVDRRESEKVSDDPVGSFCNIIQLRCVRGAWNVLNTVEQEITFKSRQDIPQPLSVVKFRIV